MRRTVLLLCMIGLTLLAGCAFSYGKYYYHDGKPCARIIDGVMGTGETETIVDGKCVTVARSTSDTGISKNGKEALAKIAEGLAKGAVKGVVPIP